MSRGWWLDEREPAEVRRRALREAPKRGWLPNQVGRLPTNAAVESEQEREDEAPKPPAWVGGMTTALAVLLVIAGAITGVAMGDNTVLGAMVVVPVLYGLTIVIARRFEEADGNPVVYSLIMAGFILKCAGVVVRYLLSATVYGGSDANEYQRYGVQIANGLRRGQLVSAGSYVGTGFLRLLTGIVYTVSPMSKLAGFFVFGWFSYVGTLLFWRAYRKAISDRNDLRYLQWLILLPTLWYWPSALGKDAFMVLCLGCAAYGAACVLTTRPLLGWLAIALGIAGVSEVRPHIGLMVFAGLVLAMLLRKWPQKGKFFALLSIGLVVVAGMVTVSQASKFLGVGVFSQDGVQKELNDVASRTGEGGSQFTPTPVHSPAQFPIAAVTVLLRPLPFDAHNAQALAVSIEDTVIIGALIVSRKRWMRALRMARKRPYVLYCIGALITFVIAYSSFSNFGLIARQRSQIAPLLVVFLCFPLAGEEEDEMVEDGSASPSSFRRPVRQG